MKKNIFDEFKKRDFIVAIIAILAIVVLAVTIKVTRKQEKTSQEELVESGIDTENTEKKDVFQEMAAGLVINEISSEGVIELYNASKESVDLSGYIVKANGEEIVIPNGSMLDEGELYTIETNLDFNRDSNVVTISNSQNDLVRAVSFDTVVSGSSYGCLTDASFEAGYITSTIGKSNNGCSFAEREDLTFSVPAGFYSDSFMLEMFAPENCKIYYTVDGREPTVESTEYTSQITISRPSGSDYVYAVSDGNGYRYVDSGSSPKTIDMGVVVKAIAVDTEGNIVYKKTVPYFIGYNSDNNYEGFSIISIEVDPEEMFGFDHGIYVPGKSYYEGWVQKNGSLGNYLNGKKTTAQLEYYESTKDVTYSSNVSLGIYNDERRGEAQKSFIISAKGEYPVGTSLNTYLNKSSNTLKLLSVGWDNETKIRNYFVDGLLEGTSIVNKYYKPCIVFINGEYWGLYTLESNYDANFFKEKLGLTEDVIAVTTPYKAPQEYIDFYNYVISTDFSVNENYQALKKMMDIDNYIEFMSANIFIGNTAMGRDNYACIWKTASSNGSGYSDGRWRWAINDVTSTLGNSNSFLDPYTKGKYSDEIINTYLTFGIKDNEFFNSLLKNDSFCEDYLSTMDRLIESNLNQQNAEAVMNDVSEKIYYGVRATRKRFLASDDDYFNVEAKRIVGYFNKRLNYFLGYTEEYIGLKGDVPGKHVHEEVENNVEETENEQLLDEAGNEQLPEETPAGN